MKYFTTILLCLTLASLIFVGCGNDDDYRNYGTFKFDNQEAIITEGNLFYLGNYYNANTSAARLVLSTGSLRYHQRENAFSGSGSLLDLFLISEPEGISSGTYQCAGYHNIDIGTATPGIFVNAIFIAKLIEGAFTEQDIIFDGEINISVNGDSYDIVFSLSNGFMPELTGHFTGKLTFYDLR